MDPSGPNAPAARPTGWHRTVLICGGIVLLLAAPIVGILPGPGGIFLVAGGLALLLKGSRRSQRLYAHAGRRWPRLTRFFDRALRRASVKRRMARAQASTTPGRD